MGLQTNIILGGLLLASLGGSVMYINMQNSKIDKLNIIRQRKDKSGKNSRINRSE